MRVLVHAVSLDGAPRMLRAAWGLALRGHLVWWRGDPLSSGGGEAVPATLTCVRSARQARQVDVLIGGGRRLVAAAWAGWMAGAQAAILALDPAVRLGFLDQAAWGGLDAVGVVESHAGEDPRATLSDVDPDRMVVWEGEPMPEPVDVTHADVELLERACERQASRQRGLALRPAVFLDRDGTVVIERGYLTHADDIELLPRTAEALRYLHAAGYALVVISNQSGVGRGLFPRSAVYEAMARLRVRLRDHGVELDAIYFCPHRPDAGCDCRKPAPRLIEDAIRNLGLAPRESAMVGDKLLDVTTGQRAGVRAILVRTGYGRDEEGRIPTESGPPPDFVADGLAEAATWLLEQDLRDGEAGRG